MLAIPILILLIVAVGGSACMVGTLFWLANRISRIEGPGADSAGRLMAENEELQEQMMLLRSEVDRLRERVDFTERLLEGPPPADEPG